MHYIYDSFEEAFVSIIQNIHKNPEHICPARGNDMMYETFGLSYRVLQPTTYQFQNESLGRIPYSYAEDFYSWMMAGCTDESTTIMAAKYPQVAGFLQKPTSKQLPANFNSFYGKRIKEQLPAVLKELVGNKNSRRAVLNILQPQDLLLLDAVEDSNLEYPCCDSVTMFVRDNQLHFHVHMRSNNMANVAKLDMYLWGRFQLDIAEELGFEVGQFNCSIASAHIFEKDFKYLESINVL